MYHGNPTTRFSATRGESAMRTMAEILAILNRPFAVSEIRWRVGQAFVKRDHNPEQGERARGRVLVYANWVPYADRLDEAFGPDGWNVRFMVTLDGDKSFTTCELSCEFPTGWVTKSNVAGETDIEGEKGAASDAFKRACAMLGLGRGLYRVGETVATLYYKGRTWVIPDEEITRLNQEYARAAGLEVEPPADQNTAPVVTREQVKSAFMRLVREIGKDAAMARLAKTKDAYGDFDSCSPENKARYLAALESAEPKESPGF